MAIPNKLKELVTDDIKWIDLRLTNLRGKEQHITVPITELGELLKNGKMFDGSSLEGWKAINESDMLLRPIPESAVVDPFVESPTINLRCSIFEPTGNKSYNRDPRAVAERAEEYLIKTKIGDKAYFGPEPEFFVFDDVRWNSDISGASYHIGSAEGFWENGKEVEGGNLGHRSPVKGGYFPVAPVDTMQDLRNEMCEAMQDMGMTLEVHHHEVAGAGQNEIGMLFNSLVNKADEVQMYKYCVHNVARLWGKTATFMPKPLVGDNGSGMHCHQSIFKKGNNIFSGKKYSGLSQEALYYIGGIIHHGRALNAFTNPSINSYKRLIPGYEAPVILAFSGRNRSASIRIPWVSSAKARRIEVRFPDCTANPYLAFSAMLMAGLDGIRNKMDPGKAAVRNLYEESEAEKKKQKTVAGTLAEAVIALSEDRKFLLQGGVFDDDMIDAYSDMLQSDVNRIKQVVHPEEFDMYYSV